MNGERQRRQADDRAVETLCPIAHSSGLVGDRWSIQIVRELFLGQSRFLDIQAQTGATSQMLAARLKRLESDGLVDREAYAQRPVRYAYRLTAKGRGLMPIILALRAWGETWCKPKAEEPAIRMFHGACGTELDLNYRCPTCESLVAWTDMQARPTAAYLAERARRAEDFAKRGRAPDVEEP